MDRVLVVGSLNMDFAVYMDRRPQAGETVMARSMKERCNYHDTGSNGICGLHDSRLC